MNRATLIILLLILGAMFSSFKIYKNDYEYGGFMKGFDASTVSQIEEGGGTYKNADGTTEDIFKLLKNNGINWIRLRLWHNPSTAEAGNNNLERTLEIAKRIKANNMKFLLDIHYSDSWADPEKQRRPAAWDSDSTIEELGAHVYSYTDEILSYLKDCPPDMVQIGNEINSGMLVTKSNATSIYDYARPTCSSWKSSKSAKNLELILQQASAAIRKHNPNIKIMIHLASDDGKSLNWWFKRIPVDFDCIGISWYPFFKSGTIDQLKENIKSLKSEFSKDVLVVETSWAWTAEWKDSMGNLLGSDEQKILAAKNMNGYLDGIDTEDFADKKGIVFSVKNQSAVIKTLIDAVKDAGGIGTFYWGGDWIPSSAIQSNWENQTFFDFDGKILESAAAFRR